MFSLSIASYFVMWSVLYHYCVITFPLQTYLCGVCCIVDLDYVFHFHIVLCKTDCVMDPFLLRILILILILDYNQNQNMRFHMFFMTLNNSL